MQIITGQMIGYRIVELCKARKTCINAVANHAGMAPSTVYSIVNGKSKNPSVASIIRICDGLDVDMREFYNFSTFNNCI